MSNSLEAVVAVTLDQSAEVAWQRLADFSLAHNYVPGLTGTEIVSAQSSGPGAHRRVYTGDKYLEETVSDWREGEGYTIALHKGARPMPPFKAAEFNYQLAALGEAQTRVVLSLRFIMPLGGFGKLLGRSLLLPVMNKQLVGVAAGMKHYYETGSPASDEDRKRLADAVDIGAASV